VVVQFPNREQAQTQLVHERGEPPANNTTEQVAFWTELIQRQMRSETDAAVRSVMADVSDLQKVVRARHELESKITQQLQQAVSRWGLAVHDVRLLEAVLDPAYQPAPPTEQVTPRTGETIRHAVLGSTPPDAPTQANQPADQTEAMVQQVMQRLQAQGKTADRNEIVRAVSEVLGQRAAPAPSRSPTDDSSFGLSN
jgi:hypothetical protein